MSKAILGTKLGMSQVFAENGDLIPVSVIEVLPNVVAAVKTVESDGYNAVQLGYGAVKEKHLTKPVKGQFEKAGIDPVKYLREYRLAEKPSYTVGQTLAADIFAEGDKIVLIPVANAAKSRLSTLLAPAAAKVSPARSNVITTSVDLNPTAPRTIVRQHPSVLVCPAAAEKYSKARRCLVSSAAYV